jgi:hypothetical protein
MAQTAAQKKAAADKRRQKAAAAKTPPEPPTPPETADAPPPATPEPVTPPETADAPPPEHRDEAGFVADAPAPAAEDEGTLEVVLRGQVSGTRDGRDWPPPGSTVTLPAVEAAHLIESKMAVDAADEDAVKAVRTALGGAPLTTTQAR